METMKNKQWKTKKEQFKSYYVVWKQKKNAYDRVEI